MASLYDSASLVMIPSGYKEDKVYSIKPTDGSGDLAFSRSNDTATRVNSSGLIEKVRTNVLLYSNDFSNAAWGLSNATLTGGQSGYDGTTNGWKLEATDVSCYISQGGYSVLRNHSVYAKAGTFDLISIIVGGYSQGVTFNLTTGAVVTNTNSALYSPVITSVGSGWYRISVGIQAAAPTYGMLIAPNDIYGGTILAGEFIYIQSAQTEYNDIATDYIATTSAAVSVGPVANLPRLDYSGGASCPKLLLESQRTNYLFPSENATSWSNGSGNVTANATISPSGYQDADEITDTGDFYKITTLTSSDLVSSTIFVKRKTADYFKMSFGSPITQRVIFNLNTGAVHSTLGSVTGVAGVDYGNGWWRFEIRGYSSGSFAYAQHHSCTSTGTQVSGAYIWGAQMEIGAYGTSYIPTLSAASTRGADAASKTGISSLIGQTEGTIFVDFVKSNNSNDMVPFNIAGSDGKLIWIRNAGAQFYGNGTTLIANIDTSAATQGTRYKLAFVYGQNDFRLYRNGSLIGTDTSGTFTGTFSDIALNSVINQANGFNQILLFKTRLTDSEAIALTTI